MTVYEGRAMTNEGVDNRLRVINYLTPAIVVLAAVVSAVSLFMPACVP